jgi:hypothetical protein
VGQTADIFPEMVTSENRETGLTGAIMLR